MAPRSRSRSPTRTEKAESFIKVANAPCSWGVIEIDGMQGSGSESESNDYEKVIDEIAESGYVGTELGDWGFMPTNGDDLGAALKKRGLGMVAAFVPVALANAEAHADGIEVAVKTAKLLASVAKADGSDEAPVIVLADENGSVPERTQNAGRIRPEHGLDDEGWKTFADGANKVARAVYKETGVKTVFHHHCAGFIETPAEVDRLLKMTDPKVLGLCLDMGHYAFGGGDPMDAFKRYGDRIWHVHFKDHQPQLAQRSRVEGWDYVKSVAEGIFCELGQGDVDFKAIISELKKRDYRGWVTVEQDVLPGMGNPIDSARRNRDFLRALGI